MSKFVSEDDYTTLEEVEAAYPSAAEIVEVDGGWMVFATMTDADTWRTQQ